MCIFFFKQYALEIFRETGGTDLHLSNRFRWEGGAGLGLLKSDN